jgi:hypothetical protein
VEHWFGDLERMALRLNKDLGWDPFGMRLYRGASTSDGFLLVPWASLVVAFWERMAARGLAHDANITARDLSSIPSRLHELAPSVFDRDLCLAEAVLAQHIPEAAPSSTQSS